LNSAPRSPSEVLRRSAASFAGRPALIGGSTALTYAELDECVDGLATRLLAAGAEPGHRVGLCVAQGPLALVASAALMRLGCAYVPLDPSHPIGRLRHIVTSSGMALAVCDTSGRGVAAGLSLRLLDVSGDDLIPHGSKADLPVLSAQADAYVMYTSGTTGLPKGVAISQANLMSLLADALPLFPFTNDEVWPLQHAYGFDVSVWEMWAGIAVGAALVAVEGDARRDPERLAELLLRHKATRLHIVPSVFLQLAEVVEEEGLHIPLRGVTFCGEPVNYRALRIWTDAQPGLAPPAWYNVYGITETTVYNTFKKISQDDVGRADPASPIGHGYRHSPVAVLDENLRGAPPGETGEIFVGGRQVAHGYIANPELSSERFLELPGRTGRWYRTGDFGYADESGSLHYVGRRDEQVKIRGFRVELGELEHAACTLPWVADAAATVVHSSPRGEPLLALFVVTTGALPDPEERTRQELGILLPPHMMPSQVIRLPELPHNANGKRDRRALSARVKQQRQGLP